jgi:putative transposase
LKISKSKNFLPSFLIKSIYDVAWKQFISFTTYKAAEAGRKVILVNPKNTSKMCSKCGQLVEKDLSVRIHSCLFCGLTLDRDLNASINILRLGLQSVGIKSLEASIEE